MLGYLKRKEETMKPYIHKVHYYETDQMKMTHHSNYIRWMEEARIDYLDQIGFGYDRIEAEGIISPVISVHCDYLRSTTFNDFIQIDVTIQDYRGTRLTLAYTMINISTQEKVAIGETTLCFLNKEGRPVVLKKANPELDAILKQG